MPGPSDVYALADLITPMALRVAATLRVADALGDDARAIGPLAAEVDADPESLARMLRHLAARGVFAEPELGSFALTPLAESLRDDAERSLRGWLDLGGFGGQMDLRFFDLLATVRAGRPRRAASRRLGRPGAHPARPASSRSTRRPPTATS